jgi:hypothetical protein
MTRLATILIGAWVLWLEVYSPKGTEIEPKGGYPANGYAACMAEARALADDHAKMFTDMKLQGVERSSSEGSERVMAKLKPGYYHWAYKCLPDTIDPRPKR